MSDFFEEIYLFNNGLSFFMVVFDDFFGENDLSVFRVDPQFDVSK